MGGHAGRELPLLYHRAGKALVFAIIIRIKATICVCQFIQYQLSVGLASVRIASWNLCTIVPASLVASSTTLR